MVLDILAVLIRLARHSLESAMRVSREGGQRMDRASQRAPPPPRGLFLLIYFMVFVTVVFVAAAVLR